MGDAENIIDHQRRSRILHGWFINVSVQHHLDIISIKRRNNMSRAADGNFLFRSIPSHKYGMLKAWLD
ncbi:MAG: hypothetical protein ACXWJD_06690, partial [Burkholderiaceae bacterium]